MNKMDEMILVAKRKNVFDNEELAFQGLLRASGSVLQIMYNIGEALEVKRRGDMEEDPSYKQPIPYFIIRNHEGKVFLYKRLGGSGESRLVEKTSIGVGGHMNHLGNMNFMNELPKNGERELNEELKLISNDGFEHSFQIDHITVAGLINDDDNEVGKVHIGLLAVIDIPKGLDVEVRETDALEGEWVTVEELQAPEAHEHLESWSQLALS